MAGPAWQSAPVYQAPGVIKGPPKEPPPQTAAQAQGDELSNARTQQLISTTAATAPWEAERARAEAERARLEAERLRREASMGSLTKEKRSELQSNLNRLQFLERGIGEVEGLYKSKFQNQGLATPLEYLPGGMRPSNARLDNAGERLSAFIATALELSGQQFNTPAEQKLFIESFLPKSGDPDSVIEDKIASLKEVLSNGRRGARKQLGLDDNGNPVAVPGAPPSGGASVSPPPRDGDIGFSGRTDPDPAPPPLSGPQAAAYDAFNQANPKATAEQLRAFGQSIGVNINNADAIVAARDAGAGVLPGSEAQLKAPDISDVRGKGGAGEQIDAIVRGVADVPTLSFADELSALGDTVTRGGTYDENLRRQRAIDDYDTENNFAFRTAGQLGGGFMLPSAGLRAGLGRLTAEGAAYGGAYGFGSGEGDVLDRGRNALMGAVIGAGGSVLAGAAGQGIANRLRRPGVAQAGADAVAAGEDLVPNSAPASQAERNALMQAADRQGIVMMPADVGGTGTRMAAGIVGRTLGGVPMAEGADAAIASSQAARDRIAGTLGTVADEAGAGQASQRGARRWLDATDKRSSSLYERIPVRPARPAVLTNTRQALGELTQGFESNPELSRIWADNPRLKATLDALTIKTQPILKGAPEGAVSSAPGQQQVGTAIEGGNLSWSDMKRLRSIVGEIAGRPALSDDGNQIASMRKLYAALSEDMRATAAAEGAGALKAFNRANDYYRARQARVDGVVTDILGADFLKGEQAAFEQINRWAQRSGGDPQRLAVALRSMGDEADTVRASIIGRMGQATPGRQNADGMAFSPAEFVTQWNKLSPRAKSALFPDAEHRAALNDLARVNAGMKRATQYSNFSNTSLGTNALAHVAGLFTSPLTTLAIAGGEFGAGKLLASPRFARWLARAPKERNPKIHIERLSTLAAREPAIAQEALGLQKWLMGAANDNLAGRAAASGNEGERNER